MTASDQPAQSRLLRILGSKYPIIQGAFGGFGNSAIAAPVSEAGGFGIIAASALRTPGRFRADIKKARAATNKPFGVNLAVGFCPQIDEMREVAIEERIPVVFTSLYRAENHGRRIKEAGLMWIHKVATVEHALAAERQGADAVVIVGLEGAGVKSLSQLPTLVSITTAARLLRIPIIAAGGIGDARGFLAALAMGAEGVYMGTRFLATSECPISERYKQALVKARPWDPAYRDLALAQPRREEYESLMKGQGDLSIGKRLSRIQQLFSEDTPDWESDYNPEAVLDKAAGSLAVGVIDSVVSVKELIDTIVRESEQIMGRPLGEIQFSGHNTREGRVTV